MKRATAPVVSLALVLGCVVGTMALGVGLKAPCASGNWGGLRQYHYLCYSDIVPLLGTEQLENADVPHSRLPFIQACRPVEGQNCDEYPVLTMYFMRVAAWISGANYSAFFFVNAALLLACALAIGLCLYMMAGRRALYFALAPTLLIYGTMNWDLLAVAFATMATYLLLRRRDAASGAMLGLGAAAKFFPGMLVVPFFAQRLRERRPDEAITLGWATVATYVLVNLPFVIIGFTSWREFFTFNATRAADFDSLWYIGCRHWSKLCVSVRVINLGSVALFVALFVLVWFLRARRFPSFPRWTLGFPLIVLFLLTNKVYSPQYGLWLLPWFALALPGLRRFIAFEIADVAVFITRFWWFSNLSGSWGPPEWVFQAMVLLRAAVLIWCVVAWVRLPYRPLPIEDPPMPTVPLGAEVQPA
jgi:uncharacterized membrane protein